MTPAFYFTPASISYLTQFLLSFAISVILVRRALKQRLPQLTLLTAFFILATIFIGLMFLDAAFSPYYRLLAVYAQNTVLALALVFLIQFAYRFPKIHPQHKFETRLSLMVSLVYFLWEGYYMIYRYYSVFIDGIVYYRPYFASYSMAAVLLIAPFAFIRQTIASDQRPVSWVKKIIKPEGKDARGARFFILVFGIMFFLGFINVLLNFRLPHTVYNAAMSIGILIALWLFASNYINFLPGGVSVRVKIIILSLTLFLALFGSAGWFIAPPYINTYQPDLSDHRSLRYTPNDVGGYDLSEIPFTYESEFGEKVTVEIFEENRNHPITFSFPFYGKTYNDIFITNSGVITLGELFWQPNMQAKTAKIPAIYALFLDLDPNPPETDRGLYANLDSENNRLIVTWDHLPAIAEPDETFTFQAILYQDGIIEINYIDLPAPYAFDPDATPSANPWVRGLSPGEGECIHVENNSGTDTCNPGGLAIFDNFYMEFRSYLHQLMAPLAAIILGGSLALLLAFPRLLNTSINQPLKNLMDGVHQMESGDLSVELPIHHNDEIGYLTKAFNSMASQLKIFLTKLEDEVAKRTSELDIANQNLKKQLSEIECLQAELKEQAIRDPLTNAYNRRYLLEALDQEISRSEREELLLSLVMIDIDHFKEINDQFGHNAGDHVLKQIVTLIMQNTRKHDIVCRYGGEEFVIMMQNTCLPDAYQRAEDLRIACEKLEIPFKGINLQATLSSGVVAFPISGINAEQLLSKADQAMYQAKSSGRNCTIIFEDYTENHLQE